MAIRLSIPEAFRGFGLPNNQAALSAGVFGMGAVLLLGLVQILGDPHAAGPRQIVPLDGGGGAFRTSLSNVVLDPNEASAAAALEAGGEQTYDPALGEAGGAGGDAPASPLPLAPIAKVAGKGPLGPLPVIAPDGTTPLKAYRRPFTGDPAKPRVAVILGGLGFNAAVTQAAIDELPADVTLSFVPYADNLQGWINKARARGHEVMIELPMESFDAAETDTGPQTLLAIAPAKDNIGKLENLLSRASGYFAVLNYQGAKFAQSSSGTPPVVRALKDRGLGLVLNNIGPRAALTTEAQRARLPFAAADRVLDDQAESDAIAGRLDDLETLAKQTGDALGAGFAYPVTVGEIKTWTGQLHAKGLVLAPASAVIESRGRQH